MDFFVHFIGYLLTSDRISLVISKAISFFDIKDSGYSFISSTQFPEMGSYCHEE